ncbi:DUF4411 family protein [Aeribacillus sp. FSL K6-2848]|uniref:DUF4411 family protein n=1 Tax=Aeribacillus sp. FSL K6-2848 TaxID=2954612 RepID=UPI0030F96D55
MSSNNKFVLDANVFIEAYNRYYSFDIAPSFWNALFEHAKSGNIISIDRVKQEINNFHKDDELSKWINNNFAQWFEPTDKEEVIYTYRKIITWAVNQNQYLDIAKNDFASVADSWLVAFAKTYNFIVVTHEQFNADIKKRIPIPNVCREFNVQYVNTFEMLRRLNIKLG